MKLKIISLNIERRKHLDKFIPFLQAENPDVVCLQEVCNLDLEKIAAETGLKHYIYEASALNDQDGDLVEEGVAIFSKYKFNQRKKWLIQTFPGMVYKEKNYFERLTNLLLGVLNVYEKNVNIFTTHPMKTFGGKFLEEQTRAKDEILKILSLRDNLVLCGDTNMPRGKENFDSIAKILKDNIPKKYKTSIDAEIHRKPDYGNFDTQMVDALFSKNLEIENVRLVSGVSDHMAVVGEIVF